MSIFKEQFDKMKQLLDSKDEQITRLSESLRAALDLVHSKNKQIDTCIESMQDAVNQLDEYKSYTQQLEESLRWYIEEDEINECDPENEYWIEGKHKAMRLLGMDVESD